MNEWIYFRSRRSVSVKSTSKGEKQKLNYKNKQTANYKGTQINLYEQGRINH